MPFTIFYAWQMDRPTNVNRWFIDRAIKLAIKQLRTEVQQERQDDDLKLDDAPVVEPEERSAVDPEPEADDSEIVLQWGAQGEPGASLIAETILQRIEDCGAFIADLTFVTTVKTADKRRKMLPNGNVLIETGAAARTGRRWDRMILVLNNAFGSVEKLPFDLKHRHCTVQYHLNGNDDPEKVNKREQLARQIADQLRPIYRSAMTAAAEERQRLRNEESIREATRADNIRVGFEEQVRGNRFHMFKAEAAIMALSIIPAMPPTLPLEFTRAREADFYKYLQSLGISNGSQIRHVPKGTICASDFEITPSAVTELHEDGSLLAVRNLIYGRDAIYAFGQKTDLTARWGLFMDTYQPELIEAVRRYLTGMKALGVAGPWFLGLSLLRMKNAVLVPSRQWNFFHDRGSAVAYQGEDMKADTVFIAMNADLSNGEAVENLLKRPLKQIWKHCNFPAYPKYTNDGFKWQE